MRRQGLTWAQAGGEPQPPVDSSVLARALGKQTLQVTSTVHDAQDDNLAFARLIKDQMFAETCDRHTARAAKLFGGESTA